jgi:hypothetical protein
MQHPFPWPIQKAEARAPAPIDFLWDAAHHPTKHWRLIEKKPDKLISSGGITVGLNQLWPAYQFCWATTGAFDGAA